jgi:peroxin-1
VSFLCCLLYNSLILLLLTPGVYIKSYLANVKKDEPVVTISPLRFKMHAKDDLDSTKFGIHETDGSRISKIPVENGDFFQEPHYGQNEDFQGADVESISESMLKHKFFIKQWLIGQLKEMALHSHTEISAVVLPREVVLHFEVIDQKLNRGVEFLYLLSVASEKSGFTDSQFDFEVPYDGPETLELHFGKLELGETVSFDSLMSTGSSDDFKLSQSSLGWVENAMSDMTKSIFSNQLCNLFLFCISFFSAYYHSYCWLLDFILHAFLC